MSTRRKPARGNPARQVVSTGLKIQARHRHNAEIPDPPPGQHLWMVLGMWHLTDPTSPWYDLDIENLMTIEGPGCFVCEQPYSAELAAAPCTGEPR